jgi:hypothetical protein
VGNIATWTGNEVVAFDGPPSSWCYAEDRYGGNQTYGFRALRDQGSGAVFPSVYASKCVYFKGKEITAPDYVLAAKIVGKKIFVLITDSTLNYLSIQSTADNGKTWVSVTRIEGPRLWSFLVGEKWSVFPPVEEGFVGFIGELFMYSIPRFNSDCTEVSFLMCANAVPDTSVPPLAQTWMNYEDIELFPDIQKYTCTITSGGDYTIIRYDADQGSTQSETIPGYDSTTYSDGFPDDYIKTVVYCEESVTPTIWETKSPDFCFYNDADELDYAYTETSSYLCRSRVEQTTVWHVVWPGTGTLVSESNNFLRQTTDRVDRVFRGITSDVTLASKDVSVDYMASGFGSYANTHIHHINGGVCLYSTPVDQSDIYSELDYTLSVDGVSVKTIHCTNTNFIGLVDNLNGMDISSVYDKRFSSRLFSATVAIKESPIHVIAWASNGDLASITGVSTGAPTDTIVTYYPMNSF